MGVQIERRRATDVLVLGAGAAGLSAALAARAASADVVVLAKSVQTETASWLAQGGVAAALNNADDGDNWQRHAEDTLASGKGLADAAAVEILCREGIDAILTLDKWGAPFDRFPDGRIAQRPYGGHRNIRACYGGDHIGQVVMTGLNAECARQGIAPEVGYVGLQLIGDLTGVTGLVALHEPTGALHRFDAKAVVLATGGFGQAFAVTTGSPAATGDGMGLALRLGIALRDMEMVQFHPTGFYPQGKLVSEACRAEGGYLVNGDGKRFMFDYDARGELATRDVVARGIQSEINAGRGLGGRPCVGLDVRHLGADTIAAKLPEALHNARTLAGVDLTRDILPVAPTQHYMMGGIPTALDGAVLTARHGGVVPGLFAAGETACVSVHGANRLGCNSMLECLVYGKRAGRASAAVLESSGHADAVVPQGAILTAEALDAYHVQLRTAMTADCGVFRTGEGLTRLLKTLTGLRTMVDWPSYAGPAMLVRRQVELRTMIELSVCTAQAALDRPQSVGAHYRSDTV
jgi:succinate dehydrogenase / fumarate reductase flavoprotein subunit